MAILPYEPFRQLEQWKSQFDKLFNESQGGFGFLSEFNAARADVFETDTEVVAHFELPGLEKKEDVQIQVEEQRLDIQGTVQRSNEFQEERMHRKERFAGRFHRTVSLPSSVIPEQTTASYKNGILEVRMPKNIKPNHPKIDVQFH